MMTIIQAVRMHYVKPWLRNVNGVFPNLMEDTMLIVRDVATGVFPLWFYPPAPEDEDEEE